MANIQIRLIFDSSNTLVNRLGPSIHSSVKLPKLLFSCSNLLQLARMGGKTLASHCGITQLHILC